VIKATADFKQNNNTMREATRKAPINDDDEKEQIYAVTELHGTYFDDCDVLDVGKFMKMDVRLKDPYKVQMITKIIHADEFNPIEDQSHSYIVKIQSDRQHLLVSV